MMLRFKSVSNLEQMLAFGVSNAAPPICRPVEMTFRFRPEAALASARPVASDRSQRCTKIFADCAGEG
jgi:hypothetical protein